MKARLLALVVVVVLAGSVSAADSPSSAKINKKIDSFSLSDASGKKIALSDLNGKKAIVVFFLSFDCPVSKSYSTTMAELAKSYEAKGVSFLGVNSNDDIDAVQIGKVAAEFQLPFPVLKDVRLQVADLFKAEAVPSAFVLDQNFVLRYRGRIDDGYAARLKQNAKITSHDLKNALDDVLSGKDVRTPVTKVIGCPVPTEKVTAKTGKVTYYRDVMPLLQEHCQQCHRPGEVGPFALMTYNQAVSWASDIKEYTRNRRMPPWKPVESQPFHNDRRLSDKEIKTLADWVDSGTPEGNSSDAPKPKSFIDGWTLGKPDLVLTVSEEMIVGPSGKDLFRVFVMPTGLTEDKYVRAIEVRPGNTRVLHHTLNFFDTKGRGRELEKLEQAKASKPEDLDHGPGYNVSMGVGFLTTADGTFGGLSGWAPGQVPRRLPDEMAWFLPKGSDLLVQAHYHRTGRTEKDRITLGLYFAKQEPKKLFKGTVLPGNGKFPYLLNIPANNENYKVTGTIWMKEDVVLYSVMPHMHMLGKKVKVTMTPPDGNTETLVGIDDWEYNWQETYWLKKPLHVKTGTRFDVEAIYDNSVKNPNNPFSPPRNVRFGEETTNEMCFIFFGMTNEGKGRVQMGFDPPK